MFRLIRAFIQMVQFAAKNGNGLTEKASVFATLCSLKFNKLVKGNARNREQVQKIFSFRVTAYDYQTLHTLFYDVFLMHPYRFTTGTATPLIIDCGANIGLSVLYFKKHYPGSEIIAIEANPYAYALLQKNISANKIAGVTAHHAALTGTKGEVPFYISDNRGTINGSIRKDVGGNTVLTVPSMRLSELMAGIHKRIDLVKMDVEGSEAEIISELSAASLLDLPDQYIIEYHHNTLSDRSSLGDFLKIFENNGFCYNLWSRSQIGKCQDLLIHFYKS